MKFAILLSLISFQSFASNASADRCNELLQFGWKEGSVCQIEKLREDSAAFTAVTAPSDDANAKLQEAVINSSKCILPLAAKCAEVLRN